MCIQVRMMDERSHHPLMKVPPVNGKGVAELARKHPKTKFLICGSYWSEIDLYASLSNVWIEISFIESGEALIKTLHKVDGSRLCFGSHSPYFYFEAVRAKLNVPKGDVSPETITGICHKNVQRLIDNERF